MTNEAHRARDVESTRRAIVDAAERLFAEKGYAATSIRDISATSGVSHPLIHHHFGSKESLYTAVKKRLIERYAQRFPAVARAVNRPLSVKAEMRRLMIYLLENDVVFRLCGWMRLEGDIKVLPGEPDIIDTLVSRVTVAQRRGQVDRDFDARALSVMIFGLIYFWVENRAHFSHRFDGAIDDEAFLRQAVALVQRGIAPFTTRPAKARRVESVVGAATRD